jgi:hypothetical protein
MTDNAGEIDSPREGRAQPRSEYVWFPKFDRSAPIRRGDFPSWEKWRDEIRRYVDGIPHAGWVLPDNKWKWDIPEPSPRPACAASAINGAIEIKLGRPDNLFDASVPYIYYYGRELTLNGMHSVGISVYNGLKACFHFGVARNQDWSLAPDLEPTDPVPFGLTTRAQSTFGVSKFRFLDRQAYEPYFLPLVKQAINEGYAVIFVASVDEHFRKDVPYLPNDDPVPVPDERPPNDHSLLAVGYQDEDEDPNRGYFRVRDSFAPQQRGLNGYLKLPYRYVDRRDLTRSFWIIEEVVTPASGEAWTEYVNNRTSLHQFADAFAEEARKAYDMYRPQDQENDRVPC